MAQMASPVASHSFTSGLVASDPIQTGTEGINRIEVYFFLARSQIFAEQPETFISKIFFLTEISPECVGDITQKPEWYFVVHNVCHFNAVVDLFKMMLVMPQTIGAKNAVHQ